MYTNVYIEITPKHHRLHIIGTDLAKAISDFSLRIEGAYFITEDENGTDNEIDDPYIKWAVGGDYSFLSDYNINLQFSEEIRNINFKNTVIANLSGRFYEDKIKIDFICFYEIENEDYLIVPKIEYSISDSLSFSSGVNIFEGKKDTMLGQYDNNDAVFVNMKYSF